MQEAVARQAKLSLEKVAAGWLSGPREIGLKTGNQGLGSLLYCVAQRISVSCCRIRHLCREFFHSFGDAFCIFLSFNKVHIN